MRTGNILTMLAVLPAGLALLFTVDALPSANLGSESYSKAVAVTVDDLPGAVPGTGQAVGELKDLQKINHTILRILKAHRAPAIGFVNEWKVQVTGERDARAALLQAWLDAGFTLGNHTYRHVSFQSAPLAQYEEETIQGQVVTQNLMKAA